MNQEHKTQPMRSTNFEFLRANAQRLSDLGAIIESHIHESPADAIADMRRYAEFLLHEFVERKGREGVKTRGDHGQHRTIEFSTLIGECSDPKKPWHVPAQQLQWFKDIKNAGDPATHDRTYEARETLRLLNTAWGLSAWVAQKLGWERPRDAFAEPQRGGEELAELRSQRDEAAQRAAGLPIDLSRWAAKQSITPFRAKKFTGRDWVYRRIEQFLNQDKKRVLVIQGDPGRGKSGVIAQFLDEHLPIETAACWHFFVDSQGEPRDWICRFYSALLSPDELKHQEPHLANADQTALLREFRHRLSENAITSQKQLLFVIDAIDEAGPSKESVAEFLRSEFPPNVRVLATVRPTHFDASQCLQIDVFDFEHPDVRNDHRNDGIAFVRTIAPANLSSDALRAIGEIGNGNFLVLSLICQELPSSALEVETYLQQLRNLDQNAPKLYEELFQRAWKRLRRLSHEALRNVYQTLALLAVCRQPLTSEMIKAVLKFETSDWDKLIDNIGEYVREDITLFDGTQTEVFSLFHATFADFVSLKLKSDARRMELKLANSCRDWIHDTPAEFERAYALRFVIHHFVHAQAWNEVEALLTDLQFIQARFEAGQGHDLLAEYDAVLKAHPQQDKEFKQRIEQDAALHQYVQDIVEYSRRCTEIRNRHEQGECKDPVAEIEKLNFPPPPDTTQTIKDMRRTEERQKKPSARKPAKPTNFSRIHEFQQFVRSTFQLLQEAPDAIVEIARNYAKHGLIADAAAKLPTPPVQLLQHILPESPDVAPFYLCSIRSAKEDYGGDINEYWMTPDARFAFIGEGHLHEFGGIYNLETSRKVTVNAGELGFPVALSPDGTWALFQATHGDSSHPLMRVDLNRPNGRHAECDEIFATGFHTNVAITPDGARVVGVMEGTLVIWDIGSNRVCKKQLANLGCDDDFTADLLRLCHSGATALIRGASDSRDAYWIVIDLVNDTIIDSSDSWKPSRAESLRSSLEIIDSKSTADRSIQLKAISLDQFTQQSDGVSVIETKSKTELRRIPKGNGDLRCISADGRYGFLKRPNTFSLVDLATGQMSAQLSPPLDASQPLLPVIPSHRDDEIALTLAELGMEFVPSTDTYDGEGVAALLETLEIAKFGMEFVPSSAISQDPRGTTPSHLRVIEKSSFWSRTPEFNFYEGSDDFPVLFGPDGTAIVFRSFKNSKTLTMINLAKGNEAILEECGDPIAFTSDGHAIIFANSDNTLRFWSIKHADWLEPKRRYSSGVVAPGIPISPDGRYMVSDGLHGRPQIVQLNQDSNWTLPRPGADPVIRGWECVFSRDARYFAEQTDDQTYLWSIAERKCVGTDHGGLISYYNSQWPSGHPWLDKEGYVRDSNGVRTGLQILDSNSRKAWVTGVRLFRIGSIDGSTPAPNSLIYLNEKQLPGTFDEEITYRCRGCGKRDRLPPKVIDTVDRIHIEFGISVADSPVLSLPDEAWDEDLMESDFAMNFKCPHCDQELRSTPFYVDRRSKRF